MDLNEARILCCQCGTVIAPNAANMCIGCIRNQVDITEGIPKQINVNCCRNCDRFLSPPTQWVTCELESKELLSICLKKLKGLSKVRLVDAGFIWTEPHSKRLKVKLTVQKEIFASAVLQQIFVVEAVVCNLQCTECTKLMAKDTWKACVQVRQKVEHKRTFFFLEQVILKHSIHREIIHLKQSRDGLDFFYSSKSHALRMLSFLQSFVPMRYKSSEQLISEDIQSGTANYKFTFSVEIAPICKDDLVILPEKVAAALGGVSPIALCSKIGTSLHFINYASLRTTELSCSGYWRQPFESLCAYRDLVEFLVLDVEVDRNCRSSEKRTLADVVVARSRDFGLNNQTFSVRTHLGSLLHAGDVVLGYDLERGNFNDCNFDSLQLKNLLPDVVLVKKKYQRQTGRKRSWRLRSLAKEQDESVMRKGENDRMEADYEQFMQDLEEDPELRSSVNIYRRKDALPPSQSMEVDVDVDDEAPEIDISEMLEDLEIGDDECSSEEE